MSKETKILFAYHPDLPPKQLEVDSVVDAWVRMKKLVAGMSRLRQQFYTEYVQDLGRYITAEMDFHLANTDEARAVLDKERRYNRRRMATIGRANALDHLRGERLLQRMTERAYRPHKIRRAVARKADWRTTK